LEAETAIIPEFRLEANARAERVQVYSSHKVDSFGGFQFIVL